jgi:hypothetical protein
LEWLLDEERVVELMIAIGEKGYFPGEILLVVENEATKERPKRDKVYTVVEGNRRLAAVKLLRDPSLGDVPRTVEINRKRAHGTLRRASETRLKQARDALVLHAARNASPERVSK